MLHARAKRGPRAVLALVAALAMGAIGAGAASADPDAAPSFSRCPVDNPSVIYCFVDLSTGGYLKINNTTVPLGDSIRIDGGMLDDGHTFVPPASGSAFTAKAINVPGGLLGIPLPLGLDTVKATAKAVGPVQLDISDMSLSVPIKIELDNPLLGPSCQIGSSSHPIQLNTITGTTAPPAPNTPITGQVGEMVMVDYDTIEFQGNRNVDNAFAVPPAMYCGYLGGLLINTLVDIKMGLPSSAGHNTMLLDHNLFIRTADVVRGS